MLPTTHPLTGAALLAFLLLWFPTLEAQARVVVGVGVGGYPYGYYPYGPYYPYHYAYAPPVILQQAPVVIQQTPTILQSIPAPNTTVIPAAPPQSIHQTVNIHTTIEKSIQPLIAPQ